jgi:hypothetical protein
MIRPSAARSTHFEQRLGSVRRRKELFGVTARNGQQSTLRAFVNDVTKRKRARIRLQLGFMEKLLPETNCFVVS